MRIMLSNNIQHGYPKSTSSLVSRPWIEVDWRARKVSKRFLTWKQIFYQTSTTPIVQRGRFLFWLRVQSLRSLLQRLAWQWPYRWLVVHQAHADFQQGKEKYGLEGNMNAELLTGSTVGILGYGDLGRAVHKVLAGFRNQILVHDPWLPDGLL